MKKLRKKYLNKKADKVVLYSFEGGTNEKCTFNICK